MDNEIPSSENKITDDASAKPPKKMRLAPRPSPLDAPTESLETEDLPAPPREYAAPRLKSREANAEYTTDEPLEALSRILEHAHKGDRARERRQRWMLRLRQSLAFLITFAVLTLAFLAAVRWGLNWRVLSFSHWIVFLIVFAVAVFAILRGNWIIQVRREGWKGFSGWCIAAILIAWNVVVYEAMAHHPERDPGASLWLPANALQAGLAVEFQRAVTGSANAYRNVSSREVVLAFRRLDRSEWREIFEHVLEPSEMSRVTYVNVDSWLPIVGERVVAYRLEALTPFFVKPTAESSEKRRIRDWVLTWAFWPYAKGIEHFGMP